MNTKKFLNGENARQAIYNGVKRVYDNVSSTMGPGGRTVLIQRSNGMPFITKDGVTVARETILEDQFESLGAEVIKQSAMKTAEEAGDGTTTTTVIAHGIISGGLEYLKDNCNVNELNKGLKYASNIAIEKLKEYSKNINSEEELLNVAEISANGDKTIANLVVELYNKVGNNGLVSFDISNVNEDELIVKEGFGFKSGYMSPYFSDKKEIILDQPKFLITDDIIDLNKLEIILRDKQTYKNPLIIITEKLPSDILTILVNMNKKGYPIIAVTAPGFGNTKLDYYNYIARLTNSKFLPKEGGGFDIYSLDVYGTCESIKIELNNTTLFGTKGNVDDIVSDLRNSLEKAKSDYDKLILKEKIASLTQSIATVKAGGKTEAEAIERKDRIEDAYYAVKSAKELGVVTGGGSALFRISMHLRELVNENKFSNNNMDFIKGIMLLSYALTEPLTVILSNNYFEAKDLTNDIFEQLKNNKNVGIDANDGKIKDFMELGIIDPVKVEISAITNAVSSAGTLLTTNCCIILSKEPMGFMTV